MERLAAELPLASDLRVQEGPYEPERFYALTRGHEEDPEGGVRCGICFEMRLRRTAEFAREIGADYYAKDAKQSADIAKAILREAEERP